MTVARVVAPGIFTGDATRGTGARGGHGGYSTYAERPTAAITPVDDHMVCNFGAFIAGIVAGNGARGERGGVRMAGNAGVSSIW